MASTRIVKVKRATDELIDDAVNRQQSWMNNRRAFTRDFLRRFNVFRGDENEKVIVTKTQKTSDDVKSDKNKSVLRSYWFPILCAIIVVIIAIVVMVFRINTPVKVFVPRVPEPIIKPVTKENKVTARQVLQNPGFDLVRIEESGRIVIAGRTATESSVSIVVNGKLVATEQTNMDGEFVYSPLTPLKPGNYEISLIDVKRDLKSADSVFAYVSERGS